MKVEGALGHVSNLLICLIREIYGFFVISKTVPRIFDNHQVILKDYLGSLFIRI